MVTLHKPGDLHHSKALIFEAMLPVDDTSLIEDQNLEKYHLLGVSAGIKGFELPPDTSQENMKMVLSTNNKHTLFLIGVETKRLDRTKMSICPEVSSRNVFQPWSEPSTSL